MRTLDPFEAGPQPGGRRPAPDGLGLVQAFVNSSYDLEFEHGAELLSSPDALRRWLSRRSLLAARARVGARDLEAALAVREGLRSLLIANNGGELDEGVLASLTQSARGAKVGIRLGAGEVGFEPADATVDGALGLILAEAGRSMLEGTWPRFKACRQHDCRWAFYDHSRNGAGNWCSMSVCGGRAKQRAYYRRRIGETGGGRRETGDRRPEAGRR